MIFHAIFFCFEFILFLIFEKKSCPDFKFRVEEPPEKVIKTTNLNHSLTTRLTSDVKGQLELFRRTEGRPRHPVGQAELITMTDPTGLA